MQLDFDRGFRSAASGADCSVTSCAFPSGSGSAPRVSELILGDGQVLRDAAWDFFEGMPAHVLIDNAKAMITTADAMSPRVNDAFADYAQAREIFVDTARVRRPQDKPRVENQVPFVRESWFDGERFVDIEDARRSAASWCRAAAERVHGTTQRVVRARYEQEEKPAMLAAPQTAVDVRCGRTAKVHPDHHQSARPPLDGSERLPGRQGCMQHAASRASSSARRSTASTSDATPSDCCRGRRCARAISFCDCARRTARRRPTRCASSR